MAKMKEIATDDPLFSEGKIQADNRKSHPLYLFKAKKRWRKQCQIRANRLLRPQ
jgi:hypothetical protein